MKKKSRGTTRTVNGEISPADPLPARGTELPHSRFCLTQNLAPHSPEVCLPREGGAKQD